MVRIPYESRAIHGPKQNRQKASHGQKNGARVVSRSGERTVRIRKVEGSIPFGSTTLGRRLWISHSGAKLWDTPVNNRGVPLFYVHFWLF